MENKDIVMRIKLLIEHENVSPSKFAKMINFNQSNLSKVLNGDRNVPTNLIKAICESLQVPYSWLVNGEGSMFLTGDITQSGDANNSGTINNDNRRYYQGCNKENSQEISELGERVTALEGAPTISYSHGKPYYNVDFLGGFDIILNDQTINPEYLVDFKKYEDADCWCNISGQSMEPKW